MRLGFVALLGLLISQPTWSHNATQVEQQVRRGILRNFIMTLDTGGFTQAKGEGVTKIESDPTRPVGTKTELLASRPDGQTPGFSCTTRKVSLEQSADEFITLNPTQEWLYPGALLQGNTIQSGTPTWIGAARGPGVISLALQTGATSELSESVPEMDRVSVTQAVNKILARYDGATPSNFTISREEIHSQEHLEAMLGANVSGFDISASASLRVSTGGRKSRLLVRIKQKFYTIVVKAPRFPEEVFRSDVKLDELLNWIQPGNAPVYVSSVNYGRMLFALLESEKTHSELQAEFDFAYNGIVTAAAAGSVDYAKSLDKTTIKITVLGGDAGRGLQGSADATESGNLKGVYEFLRGSGAFGRDNPGVPISYHMRSLRDSRPVRLAATTEYTQTDCKAVLAGCDGAVGSRKVIDQCNVCGGDNRCKRPCAAFTHTITYGNDMKIHFDLPRAQIGSPPITFEDGAYYIYKFPHCRRIYWNNMGFSCRANAAGQGGEWRPSTHSGTDEHCYNVGTVQQPYMRLEVMH